MKHQAILVFSLLIPLAACTTAPTVSLMPQEDGSFRSVATSENEQQALNSSLSLAESTCRERNLRHAVLNADSHYRGLPLRTAAPTRQEAELVAYANSPTFPSLTANDDYQVKVHFKCM